MGLPGGKGGGDGGDGWDLEVDGRKYRVRGIKANNLSFRKEDVGEVLEGTRETPLGSFSFEFRVDDTIFREQFSKIFEEYGYSMGASKGESSGGQAQSFWDWCIEAAVGERERPEGAGGLKEAVLENR